MIRLQILKGLPALVVMGVIFWFSAHPSDELPNFDWADRLVKKAGHLLGYALLAVSYAHALGRRIYGNWLAWILAMLYAITDEIHQTFVPGRNPSIWDVLIFDNLGALISIGLLRLYKAQRSDSLGPIVE